MPLRTAFVWNGGIFLREGRELPAAKQALWFRAPECATTGTFEIVADWLGVTGRAKPRFDGDLREPYRLEVHVTEGPREYLRTTITVHTDATTEPTLEPDDVRHYLWRGGPVASTVTCDDDRFRALSLRTP